MTAETLVPDFPSLVSHLRADGIVLTSKHARPLSGRTVASARDAETGRLRRVTDYERAARAWLGADGAEVDHDVLEWIGRGFRPVWEGVVDGVQIRVNEKYVEQEHHGLQYASACIACGATRWNRADRVPCPLCKKCQAPRRRPETPECDDFELACSTAYKRHGCRCDDCRAWNAAKHRLLRQRRRSTPRNPSVGSVLQDLGQTGGSAPQTLYRTNTGVTRRDLVGWYADEWEWLPEQLQESMVRYEARVEAAWEHFEREALKP